MKKFFLVLMFLCVVPLFAAESLKTVQIPWQGCGSGATPGVFSAAVAGVPAVTARSATSIEATYQTFAVDEGWSYLWFRNSSTTDADTTVYLIMWSDGADYMPAFLLTFTTGTQSNSAKAGYEFADAVALTHYLTLSDDRTAVCSPGNNYVAMFGCDRWWCKKIAIIPLTITHAAFLEITGHGQ